MMTSPNDSFAQTNRILLTGSSGYVGGQLLRRLEAEKHPIRCLSRDPANRNSGSADTQFVKADLRDASTLSEALEGIHTAYYLVHSMGFAEDFEKADREAAKNFGAAAEKSGIKRVIYLGGLGDDQDPNLSPHLSSRHEVGEILRSFRFETIEFRASAILGAGSLSFEMIRSLTNRLPIMICPRWLATPTQPISIRDLLDYLIEALTLPGQESKIYEIGGTDVVTYGQLIREYAAQQGLRRWLISVPILTPYLSGLWLGLVTPATADVGRHLIEGLKNPTIVMDPTAAQTFSVQPMGIQAAIRLALQEEEPN